MFFPNFGRGGCHIWLTHTYRLVRDRCDKHFELTGTETIFWQYGRGLSAHARPLMQVLSGDGTPWVQVPPLPSAEPRVPGVQAEGRADHHERGRGAKPAVVHLALVRPIRALRRWCASSAAMCCGPGQYGLARPLLVLWARPVWIGAAVMCCGPGRYGWARPLRTLFGGYGPLCVISPGRRASSVLGAAVIASVRGRAERKQMGAVPFRFEVLVGAHGWGRAHRCARSSSAPRL